MCQNWPTTLTSHPKPKKFESKTNISIMRPTLFSLLIDWLVGWQNYFHFCCSFTSVRIFVDLPNPPPVVCLCPFYPHFSNAVLFHLFTQPLVGFRTFFTPFHRDGWYDRRNKYIQPRQLFIQLIMRFVYNLRAWDILLRQHMHIKSCLLVWGFCFVCVEKKRIKKLKESKNADSGNRVSGISSYARQ